MPGKRKYDVFLSYRRDGGEMLAKLIHDKLSKKGMRVFLDVEALRSGPFNTKLLDVIAESTDFVIILPPKALDRCTDPNDWVRLEIEHAIKLKKNIVPVMMRGFEWPSSIPQSIASLSLYNGVSANHEYFDASVEKLMGMLQTKSKMAQTRKRNLMFAALAVITMLAVTVAFTTGLIKISPSYYIFEDSGVETLVRDALGKAEGGITQAELNTITQLPGINIWDGTAKVNDSLTIRSSDMTTRDVSIQKLADFEHLPSLERLNLCMCITVSDISPLSSLTKLTMLDLSGGNWDAPVHGLKALSNLSSLSHLDLSECRITDISPLQSLTKLKTLDLGTNSIADILPLSRLKSLTELALDSNTFEDLTPLAELYSIEKLNLSKNNIQDLSLLSGMTKMTHLSLAATGLTNLDTLPPFVYLQHLMLGENSITSIEPLGEFQALEKAYLQYNYPLSDISPLLGLPALKMLVFYQYQNFVPFEQITDLMDKGCAVLLETEQKEAMQRYYSGSYLISPSPQLKPDSQTAVSDIAGFSPHGMAVLSLLNGQTFGALANSLYLFDTDSTGHTGLKAGGALIGFTGIAEINVRHTLQEGVIAAYTPRSGEDGMEVAVPFSYREATGTLCFITAEGFPADVNIRSVTRIRFDWSQVPVAEPISSIHIIGTNVDTVVPLASIRLTVASQEFRPFSRNILTELPLTDNQLVSIADIDTAEFRNTSNNEISVIYSTVYDSQKVVDKLSKSGGELHALLGENVLTIPLKDLNSIERIEESSLREP